jgi:transposase
MDVDPTVFTDFQTAVNLMIKLGIKLKGEIFIDEGLKSVKRFYDKIYDDDELKSLNLHNRILRCAAQPAYFAVREYKTRLKIVQAITSVLAKEDHESDSLKDKINSEYGEKIQNFWLDNFIRHCINLMRKELKNQDFNFQSIDFEDNLDLDSLRKTFLRSLSRKLTLSFKRGKRTDLITKILGNEEKDSWNKQRKLWRDRIFKELKDPVVDELRSKAIEEAITNLSSDRIINHWLGDAKTYVNITGDTDDDFGDFVLAKLQLEVECAIVDTLSDVLRTSSKLTFKNIAENVVDFEKIPFFKGKSIPLGIDDGQIFKPPSEETNYVMKFTFRPYEHYKASFKDPSRYIDMLKDGYIPKRGVLLKSGSKLLLAVPFEKELPDLKTHVKRVAGIDLGIKTLSTISVYEETKEVSRLFVDQKKLGNSHSFDGSEFYNFKRKLTNLQFRASFLQSEMARLKTENGRSARNLREFQIYRKEWKKCWRKISNIHNELAIKLALNILEFCKKTEVDSIHLEDLRFASHGSKNEVGYWLTTWQIHWFFAKMQFFIKSFSRRHGIRVALVDARNTSKFCSGCGEFGIRDGKRFRCNCGLKLDSDLNAARNLAQITP